MEGNLGYIGEWGYEYREGGRERGKEGKRETEGKREERRKGVRENPSPGLFL